MTESERDAIFRASGWRVVAYLYGVLKGAVGTRVADASLLDAVHYSRVEVTLDGVCSDQKPA
jgi:hypothetical protein